METQELIEKTASKLAAKGEVPQDIIYQALSKLEISKHIDEMYGDLEILLPKNFDANKGEDLVKMAVLLSYDYDLHETDIPNIYRLFLQINEDDIIPFECITKVEELVSCNLSILLKDFCEAFKNNDWTAYDDLFKKKVSKWNLNKLLIQERVYKLSTEHTIPKIAERTNCPEELILTILTDYNQRLDNLKLNNLKSFLAKLSTIISETPDEKQEVKEYLQFLMDEILTGGKRMKSHSNFFIPITLRTDASVNN